MTGAAAGAASPALVVLDGVLAAAGAFVVVVTVVSALRTVVLPPGEPVRLTYALFALVGLPWRWATRLLRRRPRVGWHDYVARDRHLVMYAPVTLALLPAVWLAAVLAGFTPMYRLAGEGSWAEALEVSGSSLLTLGFTRPGTPAGVTLSFLQAGLAFALLGLLLVTYLPTMYGAWRDREQGVGLLEVRGGHPPTGVDVLVYAGRTGTVDDLPGEWEQWARWFVDLRQTHTSFTPVVFFRGSSPGRSWVAASGAMLDAAALDASLVARQGPDRADGCLRAGTSALHAIALTLGLHERHGDPVGDRPSLVDRDAFDEACRTLEQAGVPLVADRDRAWRAFAAWRVTYEAPLVALAHATLAPPAPWLPDVVDDPGAGTQTSVLARPGRVAMQLQRLDRFGPRPGPRRPETPEA